MSTRDLGLVHRFESARNGDTRTLLLLHGTGGNENDLLPLGRALSPDAALLSVRGMVLENGMPRFFRRLAEGVFDVGDLVKRTHELADFVGQAAQHYEFNAENVIAAGYSNGANIAASILFLRSGALRGGVLFRPMVPHSYAQKPDLSSTPVFVAAGKHDPLVPSENTRLLVSMLEDWNADVTLRWHEGGHEMARDEVEAATRWLAQNSDGASTDATSQDESSHGI